MGSVRWWDDKFMILKFRLGVNLRFYGLAAVMMLLVLSNVVNAGGFFETGVVTINDTVDSGGWETVTLTKTFVNPVIVAGPISHNNSHSLFVRIRNVSATGFEIGMQSPCESYATYAGPRPADPLPEQAVCPPAAGWVSEEVSYWVMEEGVWEFPDGTEVEAFIENTNAIRSGVGADTRLVVDLNHTYSASNLVVYHSVMSGGGDFIYSLATRDDSFVNPPTPTAADNDFGLSLEGMEFTAAHGAEDIGWIAMLPASGSNAGSAYNAGRTGETIDRHEDGCFTTGAAPDTVVISQPLTMNGGNGAGVRICDTGPGGTFNVHMDEDQVNDAERTGIPEAVSFFTHSGGFGALDFITGTKTVADDNGGTVLPGDLLTYTVVLTNELNDFDQANNAGNEFEDVLDSNVTFDSVVSTPAGTSLVENSGTMEWNGTILQSSTRTFSYRVRVNDDVCGAGGTISNQGTIFMDANGDGANSITEVTDGPVTLGGDSDEDNLLDDDDPTQIAINCTVDLEIRKGDALATYTPGGTSTYTIQVRNAGPARVTGATIADDLPDGVTMTSAWTCTPSSANSACNTTPSTTDPISIDVDIAAGDSITVTVPVQFSADMSDF